MQSLPPKVQEAPRGLGKISFGPIQWHVDTPLPQHPISIRFAWWGTDEVETVPIGPTGGSASFVVRTSPEHLLNYFTDARELDLDIVSTRADASRGAKALPLGRVALDLASAGPRALRGDAGWSMLPMSGCGTHANECIGALPCCLMVAFGGSQQHKSDGTAAPQHQTIDHDDHLQLEHRSHERQHREEDAVPATIPSARGVASGMVAYETGSHDDQEISNTLVQQPQPQPEEDMETTEDFAIEISIDSAFQLPQGPPQDPAGWRSPSAPSTSTQNESSYFAYASAMCQRDRNRQYNTHVAPVFDVPPAGHTAVWNSKLCVSVDPTEFADAADALLHSSRPSELIADHGANPSGLLDGPLLLLNVWMSGALEPDPVETLEAMRRSKHARAPQPARRTPFDRLIGCALVDLRQFLMQRNEGNPRGGGGGGGGGLIGEAMDVIEGRFQLIDARHQAQGLIKATIRPNKTLLSALAELRAMFPRVDSSDSRQKRHPIASEEKSKPSPSPQPLAEEHEQHFREPSARLHFETTDVLCAADDEDYMPTIDGTMQAGYHVEQKQSLARDVPIRYAWSGSDSDDAHMGLGMCFEGAVSCSDGDEEREEDFGRAVLGVAAANEHRGKGYAHAGAARADRSPSSGLLVSDDWLFDIGKTGQCADDLGAEDGADVAVEGHDCHVAADAVVNRPRVAFKNRLPCAFVMPATGSTGSSQADEESAGEAEFDQDQKTSSLPDGDAASPGGGEPNPIGGDANALDGRALHALSLDDARLPTGSRFPEHVPAVSSRQSNQRAAQEDDRNALARPPPPHATVHLSELPEDWLFDIGRPAAAAPASLATRTERSTRAASPPCETGLQQFAPMAKQTAVQGTPAQRQNPQPGAPRSPTLTEVLQSLNASRAKK